MTFLVVAAVMGTSPAAMAHASPVPGVPAEAVSSNVAQQWERSFNPAAVSRSLGTDPGVVLVVPAGPQSDDLDAAARVLHRTVQSGTEAERGLRAARVEGDDDQKVVRQAANQAQFDRALVVRLFEDGGELEAIVTLSVRELKTLRDRCNCMTVAVPAGTPVFVDGRMRGIGPAVSFIAERGRGYEVTAVVRGKRRSKTVRFPHQRRVSLY